MAEYEKLDVKRLDKVEFLNKYTVQVDLDNDGTRYGVILIPFTGNIGCVFMSMRNGVMVIDGGEKTSYTFHLDSYLSVDYVAEKLQREKGRFASIPDMKNTTNAIRKGMDKIKEMMEADNYLDQFLGRN
jgi:hypothetical protein